MRRSDLAFLAVSVFAAAVVAAFVAWTVLDWPGKVTLDDLGEMVAALLGAAACAVAAWRHRGRARAAWAFMGASALAWGAGEAVWSWYELHLDRQVPFPTVADAGFLAAVPLAVVASLLFPAARLHGRTRAAGILDGLIIASGLLAVSWVTVLHSVYAAGADGALAQVLSIAYPAGDVLIATMLTTLVLRLPRGNRFPLLLLVAGLAGNALSDSSFTYLTAQGAYGSGSALDAGWVAGYILLALGALRAAQRPVTAQAEPVVSSWWRLVVPYVPMAAAVAAGAREVIVNQALEPFVFWLIVALIGFVVGRQFLTLSDNHALLRDLGVREAEMRRRAFHDPLTGLANRALFGRRVDAALAATDIGEAAFVAALVIDLDDFKDVNDTLGHEAGDRLLVEVGARLLDSVRPGDTVARLGGDEFAILLDVVHDHRQAEHVAARVVAALHHSADVGQQLVPVQASVGLAVASAGGVTQNELLRRADVAMYRAKGDGKGRWVTYGDVVEAESHRVGMDGDVLTRRMAG